MFLAKFNDENFKLMIKIMKFAEEHGLYLYFGSCTKYYLGNLQVSFVDFWLGSVCKISQIIFRAVTDSYFCA